jgi:hypothetical protein
MNASNAVSKTVKVKLAAEPTIPIKLNVKR